MDNTLIKVKSILAKNLGFSEEQITEDSKLIDDLQADSLDIVEISMTLENVFNLTLTDQVVEKFITVKDIVNYLHKTNN